MPGDYPSCTRRQFLQSISLAAAGGILSGAAAKPRNATLNHPADADRILVIIHLAGGNDGLNTVVPYEDDSYYRSRPVLAIPKAQVIQVYDHAGLHPALAPLLNLAGEARFSVIQGVGYPDHDSSHFRAIRTWNCAAAGGGIHTESWAERYLAAAGLDPDYALAIEPPAKSSNDYKSGIHYPDDPFAAKLRTVAMMICSGSPARVFHVKQDGFDTHAHQLHAHAQRLRQFSQAIAAFQADLHKQRQTDRVLTMTFSEFGRRVAENPAGGTDHGTAGPMLIIGTHNKPGLIGSAPRLDDLEHGNLKFTTDFRSVYAAVLEQWLRAESQTIVGKQSPIRLI